jgi:arylsulfatase A-like enzyme
LVDQSIGAILGCLERCGIREHTVVVHTSDHGDSLGAHHLFGKETMFEEAARVPWLIRLAGQTRQKTISHPVSHIDFVPTLLDLLGQSAHPQCAGKSLLPLMTGVNAPGYSEEDAGPRNVFLEWAPNRTKVKKGSRLARRRMIKRAVEESTRTLVSPDGWKLCLRDRDLNELYNLNEDPFETRNVYLHPGCASVVSRLADDIHRWQEFTNDKLKL